MSYIFRNRQTYVVSALLAVGVVLVMLFYVSTSDTTPLITTTVENGDVRELVSVSGIAEAKQLAELSFPVSGTVREVFVQKGDQVEVDDPLLVLDTQSLYADKEEAIAVLSKSLADRNELLAGPTTLTQSVTTETLANQQAMLAATRETESQKVQNAYRTLLSSELTAYTMNAAEAASAPSVSGTYLCDQEGTYLIDVYSSSAKSGYSYRLSGLETGLYSAYTDQPGPLGVCGLSLLFDSDSEYSNSQWLIDIPNQRSVVYTTNRNAYTLALTQANTAITLAEQAVTLAEANAANQNAPARSEALARANASVAQAQARLNRIEIAIAERTLTAPFPGTVTDVSVTPGETISTTPVVTLLAGSSFEVVARIPEIDIGKIHTGQAVEMMFDTKPQEIQSGLISFVSPRSTQIDGVAYFEAVIQFKRLPDWMRGGLNADIEILIHKLSDTLRIPRRFVIEEDSQYFVRKLLDEDVILQIPIEVIFAGNDGFFAITGVTEGDTLVAP